MEFMSSDRGLSQEYSAMSADSVNQYQQGLDDLKGEIADSKTAFGNNALNFQNTLSNLGTDSTQLTEKDSVVPGGKFAELAKGANDFLASRREAKGALEVASKATGEGEKAGNVVYKFGVTATKGAVDSTGKVVEASSKVGLETGETLVKGTAEAGGDVAKTMGDSAKAFGKLGAVAGLGDVVGFGLDIDDLTKKGLTTGDKVKDSLGIVGAGLDMAGLGLDATGGGAVLGVPLQILGTTAQIVSSVWGWVEDDAKAKQAKETAQETETKLQNANLAKRKTEIQTYNIEKAQPLEAQKSITQAGGASVGRISQF